MRIYCVSADVRGVIKNSAIKTMQTDFAENMVIFTNYVIFLETMNLISHSHSIFHYGTRLQINHAIRNKVVRDTNSALIYNDGFLKGRSVSPAQSRTVTLFLIKFARCCGYASRDRKL